MKKRQDDVLYDTEAGNSLGQATLNTADACEKSVYRSSKVAVSMVATLGRFMPNFVLKI
jgi:hypothetical protein